MDTVEKIKSDLYQQLAQGLGHLEAGTSCTLVCYPNHHNIGDHMIWLGEIIYLVECAKLHIDNIFTIEDFRREDVKSKIGTSPLIVHGGGNFGDVWSYYKEFYQELVQNYPSNEIIFLPQTLFFKFPGAKKKTRRGFLFSSKTNNFCS